MAAEEVLKKFEHQLNCPICLDTFTDPKLLQCHHVCCKKCLEKLVRQGRQGRRSVECPNCRGVTSLSTKGVAGLQSAFYINHLLEIQEPLRKLCIEAPVAVGGEARSLSPVRKASYCPQHSSKELELYCETCMELICCYCAIKGGKHRTHDHERLSELMKDYIEELQAVVKPMGADFLRFRVNILKLKSHELDLEHHLALFKTRISIYEVSNFEAKDTRLWYTYSQQQIVSDQRTKLFKFMSMIEAMFDSYSKLLDSYHSDDPGTKVVSLKRAQKDYNELHPKLMMVCQEMEEVRLLRLLDPLQCDATGKGLCMAVIGQESTATFDVISYTGEPYEGEVRAECELFSELNKTKVHGFVHKIDESHYKVSYLPTVKGKQLLHIKVNGQDIRESPFSVNIVKTPAETVGYPINTLYDLKNPLGVAVNREGQVFVCEGEGECISVFSPSGEKIRSFGTPELRQNQLKCPRGIAVDDTRGKVLVNDNKNRIYRFTATGHLCQRTVRNYFGNLQCIAFNEMNDKFYTADNYCRIWILNSDLTLFGLLGGYGVGKGQFICPYGIACDNTGKVYVADSGNHRIQVFTADGKFVRMFGRYGKSKGELDSPVSVAVDTSQTVYVCEHNNCRISLFTTDGHFITSFGEPGVRPGEFICPGGIAVDADRMLYVCDRTSRVQVFSCKDIHHHPFPSKLTLTLVVFVISIIFFILVGYVIF